MIRSVLIDIDNTLLDFAKSAEKAISTLFKEKQFEYNENVMPTFHRINDELWHQIEQKIITKQEMYGLRWKNVFSALGIDNYDSDKFELEFRSTLSGIAEPVDNAFGMLEYLYGKYKLYAASNSSYEHQIKRLTSSDMLRYFDDVFVSEKVGALKPAKEFFEFCQINTQSSSKDEMILIGDSITADILGGFDYGIKTVWYNPNGLEIPESPRPDYTINDLLEIKNIL